MEDSQIKVYITGYAIACSIGKNENEIINNMHNCGIKPQEEYTSKRNNFDINLGLLSYNEIKNFNDYVLYCIDKAISLDKKNSKQCNINNPSYALIISSTAYCSKLFEDNFVGDKDILHMLHPGFYNKLICDHIRFSGLIINNQNACASSSYSIVYAKKLLEQKIVDKVIVVGMDEICQSSVHGFDSLNLLDSDLVKPYDRHRNGTNLGEGIGVLILSGVEKNDIDLPKIKFAESYNDGYHMTSISDEFIGFENIMSISDYVLTKDPIDLITVHGTGTENNDLSEGKFLRKYFPEVEFSSFKSTIGHTLSASAIIDVVLSLICMKNKIVIPTLGFKNKIHEHEMSPITKFRKKDLKNIINLSSGMGGFTSIINVGI